MTTPYIGQISLFSFNFAPKGWALCNGQLLPVAQNQALFALIGANFGGDGRTTFALPNLQGAAALGTGPNAPYAGSGGEASHTLTVNETPVHAHTLNADGSNPPNNNGVNPAGALLGISAGKDAGGNPFVFNVYNNSSGSTGSLAAGAVTTVGGAPHDNHMPSLAMNYCIALSGVYPTRS